MIAFSALDLSPILKAPRAADAFRNSLDLARHAEALGLQALLARRTSQYAGHRQRGDGGRDRPCRGRHEDDPRRRRRHHAAQPCAAGDRRAVRHARIALSRPHRSGPRPRARHRHAHRAGAAPRSRHRRRPVPARRRRAARSTSATPSPTRQIRAVPGAGLNVPLWILGSSLFGAQLAAISGLPFAFASHFAPDALMQAIAIYRERFQPSAQLAAPYVDRRASMSSPPTPTSEARRLFTSLQQSFVRSAARTARTIAAAGRRHRQFRHARRKEAAPIIR